MNSNLKIMLSRLIIITGLLYQLFYMTYINKNKVSYVSYVILSIGAFFTITSEEKWLNVKFTNILTTINIGLFILQVLLFISIAYTSYNSTYK